ncbi:MAG: site-specific tyrosine recombinase XerC [Burkholderiales bacterium]|nr:site-specific tyrosine recombinase XerC [Burkholderiales bacterium]
MARTLTPRRRPGRKRGRPFDPAPGNPLHAYLDTWIEWALAAGFSEHTMRTRRFAVLRFIVWCDERGITTPTEITRPMLERYQRTLHQYRKTNGAPLSVIAQLGLLNALVAWFRWMVRQHHLLHNPAADLELPKKPKALPKTILTVPQVETILNQADPATLMGIRNRAMMEVFYSTGIRRQEMIGLKLYDVDTERGTLMVRQGKGAKDRFIPIGSRACAWVDKYLVEVRPEIVAGFDDQTLFLDDFGRPMDVRFLGDLMRRHVEAGGITTPGACHVFRHAMATHMLENGADIRFIQAMLGHANLETTQIYTQVSMTKLKEIHTATHPARLQRRQDAQPARAGADLDEDARALLEAIQADGDDEADDGDEPDAVAADAPQAGRR